MALNWFPAGTLPVPARHLPAGTVVVEPRTQPVGTSGRDHGPRARGCCGDSSRRPASPGDRPARVASPAVAGGPAPGPGQTHPAPALAAVAPHPGPHRDTPTPRSPTPTATACTNSPPDSRQPTRSCSRTCTSPGCLPTGAWPGTSPGSAWPNSDARSPTKPPGPVGPCTSRTAGIPPPQRVRAVAW
jgi:hypothetical protein